VGGRPGVSSGNMDENIAKQRGKGWTAESRRKAALTRAAKKDGQAVALKLISDRVYVRNLQKRLREGTAGPIENLLWLLAHGKPREQTTGEDIQARIVEVREAAKKAIREARPRLALAAPRVVDAEVIQDGDDGGP
jgi:hypothetical protein